MAECGWVWVGVGEGIVLYDFELILGVLVIGSRVGWGKVEVSEICVV